MSSWNTARGLLTGSVIRHLGEDLLLTAAGGTVTETVRGVLTRPEEVERLGLSQAVQGAARLTLRKADVPDWIKRGVHVITEMGEEYDVTATTDNGEGMLEITLCRSL